MNYQTKGDIETDMLRGLEAILRFKDPNSVKASLILQMLRTILKVKDLGTVPEMYEALKDIIKAASFCHADAGLKIWIDKANLTLAKVEGKDG